MPALSLLLQEPKKQQENKMPTLEFHEKLPTIHQLKSLLVREAMKRSSGNLDHAAGMLGISRQTMMKYVMDEFHR
ncbi:MAG: hypothetical protein C4522_18870 [Desulfobacteraceae bacterium]|nr:MAG: hypothetical protein C4522_18870 [Desulfobacteraceae bacterium]